MLFSLYGITFLEESRVMKVFVFKELCSNFLVVISFTPILFPPHMESSLNYFKKSNFLILNNINLKKNIESLILRLGQINVNFLYYKVQMFLCEILGLQSIASVYLFSLIFHYFSKLLCSLFCPLLALVQCLLCGRSWIICFV